MSEIFKLISKIIIGAFLLAGNAHNNIDEYIDIFDPEDSKLYDPRMATLLDSLVQEVQMGNVPVLHQFIGDLESNNKLTARNPISNAAGIYQFVPEEVKTTKRRAIRNVGFDPEYIKAIPNDPTLWNQEQSDIMLMSRLFPMEEKGKPFYMDKLLKRAYRQDWDIDDFLEIYDKHHTLVDKSRYKKEIDLNKKRVIDKYLNP